MRHICLYTWGPDFHCVVRTGSPEVVQEALADLKRNSSVVFLAVFSEYSSAGPLSESSKASHTGEMENKRSKRSILYILYNTNKTKDLSMF